MGLFDRIGDAVRGFVENLFVGEVEKEGFGSPPPSYEEELEGYVETRHINEGTGVLEQEEIEWYDREPTLDELYDWMDSIPGDYMLFYMEGDYDPSP